MFDHRWSNVINHLPEVTLQSLQHSGLYLVLLLSQELFTGSVQELGVLHDLNLQQHLSRFINLFIIHSSSCEKFIPYLSIFRAEFEFQFNLHILSRNAAIFIKSGKAPTLPEPPRWQWAAHPELSPRFHILGSGSSPGGRIGFSQIYLFIVKNECDRTTKIVKRAFS